VLAHRLAALAVMGLLTVLAGLSLTRAVVRTSMTAIFFDEESTSFKAYKAHVAQFGNDDVVVVAVETDDPLSPANLDRLEALHAKLEAHGDVARVTSLHTAALQRATDDGGTRFLKIPKEARAAKDGGAALIRELQADEIAGGLVLGQDGKSFGVLIELTWDPARSVEVGDVVLDEIYAIFADVGYRPEQLHRAGLTSSMAEVLDQSRWHIEVLFPITVVVLLLVVYLIFGRLWPVFITGLAAGLAVVWTLGFAMVLDRDLHIMMTAVPCVVMIISFSDVIHLISAYLLELGDDKPKEEAIVAATADVGAACFLTSITTMVGFLSLSFVPTPVFQQFGITMGFGVVVAFVLAVTLVPILFSLMATPKSWSLGVAGKVQGLMDRVLDELASLTTRHPWPIIVAFVFLTAASVYGITLIEFDADVNSRLTADNPVRVDQRFFEEQYVGTSSIDIFVTAAQPGGLLEPDVFNAMAKLDRDVEALPGVDRVLGFPDLVREAWRALLPDLPPDKFIPLTKNGIAQLMIFVGQRSEDDLAPFVDFGRTRAHMVVYTKAQGVTVLHELGKQVQALADQHMGAGAKVEVTGIRYLFGAWVEFIIEGQRNGLLFSVFAIALLMMIGLRSIRAGLGSMLPNFLPLLVLFGVCGFVFDTTDTDTLILGMIAIGIGVDDTIHFLARLRIESDRTDDPAVAIRRTFRFSGRGIVITTALFVAGFAPFMMADYLTIQFFGTLLPMTFLVALATDVLLLPALVSVGLIRFQRRKT
jgi:uncharacterized protein